MKTPSCFWLPLTVSALITNVLAQALGADPSIQAPGATIPINTTLTVNLFGTLPPFLVQLVQSGSNIVVQVIAPEEGFFQTTWNTPSPPTINCFELYALQVIDVIERSALSNSFNFTGCPNTETTVTSTFTEESTVTSTFTEESTATSTFTEESTTTSTFTDDSTVTSTFTKTVTESASTMPSCPVSVSVSTVTSTFTEASCPVSASSLTKVTKVTVYSTETITKVKTDRDATTTLTSATRTITEYAHTTTITVDLTQTRTKTDIVCETTTTSTTRKGPCHPHY